MFSRPIFAIFMRSGVPPKCAIFHSQAFRSIFITDQVKSKAILSQRIIILVMHESGMHARIIIEEDLSIFRVHDFFFQTDLQFQRPKCRLQECFSRLSQLLESFFPFSICSSSASLYHECRHREHFLDGDCRALLFENYCHTSGTSNA